MMTRFEFRIASAEMERFESTVAECHRRGDDLATRLGRPVGVYAFNEIFNRWDFLGTYRGWHLFSDSSGDERVIKQDYSGLFAKEERKEVAV